MSDPVDEWADWRTPSVLRPFVATYTGYRQENVGPSRHRGLPSRWLTVIFTLDHPLTVAEHPDPGQPAGTYRTLIGGLHTRPALITHQGAQSGIQLRVSPLAARALFAVPAGELAELDLSGSEVLGRCADRLQERLQAAHGWPQRFALLDEFVVARVRATADRGGAGSATVRPEVVRAWERITSSAGSVPIARVAAEVGLSGRHLGELFRREVGLSPKEAARVARFHRAQRMIQATSRPGGPGLSLGRVAAACGYFDQSHLDREFGRLAGAAPTRWLADELRNVQVPPGSVLPDSIHDN